MFYSRQAAVGILHGARESCRKLRVNVLEGYTILLEEFFFLQTSLLAKTVTSPLHKQFICEEAAFS